MFNRKIKKRKRQFVNSIIYIRKIRVFMLKCLSRKSLDRVITVTLNQRKESRVLLLTIELL